MTRLLVRFGFYAVSSACICCTMCLAQGASQGSTPDPAQTQNQSRTSPPSSGQTKDGAANPAATKKKKVWTNDDVGSLSGGVSVTGNTRNLGPAGGEGQPDAQYAANLKKQLEKLQGQLDETNKELVAFQDFQQGKAPEPAGYQINKGYKRVPVDQQIASLEEKKKQLEDKIGALLDEARKKGVPPGQLR